MKNIQFKFRIHFLLWLLPKCIVKSYKIKYDYFTHNYLLYRAQNGLLIDCFIIVRSSEKCFRMSYFNALTLFSCYCSFRSCSKLVVKIVDIYNMGDNNK